MNDIVILLCSNKSILQLDILDYCLDCLPKERRVFAAEPDLNIDQTQALDPLQREHLQSQAFINALSLCVHIHLGQWFTCFLFLIMLVRCFMTISCMHLNAF